MSCITSCFRAIFCCSCCRKKKLISEEAAHISENVIKEVYKVTMISEKPISLAKIHENRIESQSPVGAPDDRIDRTAHNRFVSTDVISLKTVLRE